jgi:DNA-directed RNA polymerase specialized sigma subunit
LQWHEKLNSFAAGTLKGDIREELRYKDITHIPVNIVMLQS